MLSIVTKFSKKNWKPLSQNATWKIVSAWLHCSFKISKQIAPFEFTLQQYNFIVKWHFGGLNGKSDGQNIIRKKTPPAIGESCKPRIVACSDTHSQPEEEATSPNAWVSGTQTEQSKLHKPHEGLPLEHDISFGPAELLADRSESKSWTSFCILFSAIATRFPAGGWHNDQLTLRKCTRTTLKTPYLSNL